MVRWMYNVPVRDGSTSEEVRSRLATENISEVTRTNGLCWSDQKQMKDEKDQVKRVRYFEVESRVPAGRPMKAWDEVLWKDLESKI